MNSPEEFVEKFGQALAVSTETVKKYFVFGVDEKGWVYARNIPERWLDKADFKALCLLAKNLGGDYVKEKQTWQVPGPAGSGQPLRQTAPQPTTTEPAVTTANQPASLQEPIVP